MNRVIVTFLGLLVLAVLAAGQLWKQIELLGVGRAEGATAAPVVVMAIFSAALLGVALVGLSRILYRTAARAPIPFDQRR